MFKLPPRYAAAQHIQRKGVEQEILGVPEADSQIVKKLHHQRGADRANSVTRARVLRFGRLDHDEQLLS